MLDFKKMENNELIKFREDVEKRIQDIIFDMRLNTNIEELEEQLTAINKEIKIRDLNKE